MNDADARVEGVVTFEERKPHVEEEEDESLRTDERRKGGRGRDVALLVAFLIGGLIAILVVVMVIDGIVTSIGLPDGFGVFMGLVVAGVIGGWVLRPPGFRM